MVLQMNETEKTFEQMDALVKYLGIPIIYLEKTSKWKYVNPAFEKFFGFTKKEVLGKHTFETPIITDQAKKIITEQRKLYGKKDIVTYEAPFNRKSGDIVQMLVTETCIYNKQGEATNWVVELTDITNIAELKKREQDLIDKIKIIEDQQIAIQELSTPILEIWDDVLVLPLIGVIDTKRSMDIMENVLTTIVSTKSCFMILDVTGVEVIDTRTADHIIKLIKAVNLLGATCIVTGIRPAVAQTMVDIGMDLTSFKTMRSLRDGLKECLGLMKVNL
jgi:rsbT co-antagonist protein RsbR